jgi:hypothetical protein
LEEFLPFLFGKEINNHVLVSNWANGWNLPENNQQKTDNNRTIIIYYLPQLLEFIGLGLLPLSFVFLLFFKHKKIRHPPPLA